MSIFVLVDDSDTSIEYSPQSTSQEKAANGWLVGQQGSSTEFWGTTTSTANVTSTLTFNFTGISVSVYCKTAGANDGLSSNTTVAFSIDGESVDSPYTAHVQGNTRYHVPVFSASSLSPTQHTLSITVPASDIAPPDFQLDYIIYEAVTNTSIPKTDPNSKTSWVFIDDTSPYLISPGGWTHTLPNFPPAGAPPDFNLTDASFNSSVIGPTMPWATMSLDFCGATYMEMHGMLLSNTSSGALGSYTIDGLGNTSLSYPINGTYPFYNYKLMDATILDPNTAHRLEVVASEGQAFYIDYIILRSPTAFVTSSRSLAAGNDSSSHKGAIAAGVVVGVLLSVVAVLIFLFLRRRRQIRRRDREGRLMGDDVLSSATEQLGAEGQFDALEQGGSVETHTERDPNLTITPFMTAALDPYFPPMPITRPKPGSATVLTYNRQPSNNNINLGTAVDPVVNSSDSESRIRPLPPLPPTQEPSVIEESDSGLRGAVVTAKSMRLPPRYTET